MSKAPGRNEREGITITDLIQMFPDNKTAEQWFEQRIWGGKPKCPRCGNHEKIKTTNHHSMPYYCGGLGNCHKRFSVKTGTIMEASNIGYQKWAIATYLFATSLKSISSMKIHRDLGITQKSAWFMVQRLRESWKTLAGSDKMVGPVEIDEAYFGGKEQHKHADKKKVTKKVAVVGMKDRKTGNIRASPVPETTIARLGKFIDDNAEAGATHYTDENPTYRSLPNHQTVNHSVSQYVNGMAHVNGLESFWALLRRGYHGTFHHVSPKHLHRYVNEFAGRLNTRPLDTIEVMGSMARGMAGHRLTYANLVG